MLQRTLQPLGTLPVAQKSKEVTKKNTLWHRSSGSNNNTTATASLKTKVKTYFRQKEHGAIKQNRSSWKSIWKSKSTKQDVQPNKVGTVFSVNVPITISNTTHYHGDTDKKSVTSSMVQQLIILPPVQVYGVLFVIVLSLLVLAFAILEVHRVISIIRSVIDGIKFLLVGLTAKTMIVFSFLKSYCF